jgi:two-component system response regulator HydG
MQRLFELLGKVSSSDAPLLLQGETGTGKGLAARAIHESGPRRNGPFVTVDGGALAPTLIESELFGHLQGAFTGAVRSKRGLMQEADGGTLFLDEVADLPVELQPRLLRAIQEKEIRPLGSTKSIRFHTRIIAATNQDLETAIRHGRFREDLLYRLNVVSITLQPLRERKTDIPLLVDAILRKLSGSRQTNQSGICWTLSQEALNLLLAYDWPGNVRELENCLEFAVTLGSSPVIGVADLPHWLVASPSGTESNLGTSASSMKEMERQVILQTMRKTGGNKGLAARMLKIGKTTIYRKLKDYRKQVESRQGWPPAAADPFPNDNGFHYLP